MEAENIYKPLSVYYLILFFFYKTFKSFSHMTILKTDYSINNYFDYTLYKKTVILILYHTYIFMYNLPCISCQVLDDIYLRI